MCVRMFIIMHVFLQAVTHVQNIEDRLRGILKTKTKQRGLPLSIEGHVKNLIQVGTPTFGLLQS